ncbi:MAG: hypothetical protein KF752_14995 [Pirellulaceae bacterium]|nr:hypothetical protein [Pirellulaceae bacterium]
MKNRVRIGLRALAAVLLTVGLAGSASAQWGGAGCQHGHYHGAYRAGYGPTLGYSRSSYYGPNYYAPRYYASPGVYGAGYYGNPGMNWSQRVVVPTAVYPSYRPVMVVPSPVGPAWGMGYGPGVGLRIGF